MKNGNPIYCSTESGASLIIEIALIIASMLIGSRCKVKAMKSLTVRFKKNSEKDTRAYGTRRKRFPRDSFSVEPARVGVLTKLSPAPVPCNRKNAFIKEGVCLHVTRAFDDDIGNWDAGDFNMNDEFCSERAIKQIRAEENAARFPFTSSNNQPIIGEVVMRASLLRTPRRLSIEVGTDTANEPCTLDCTPGSEDPNWNLMSGSKHKESQTTTLRRGKIVQTTTILKASPFLAQVWEGIGARMLPDMARPK